ncbi:MAG TPA: UGSC family (seleno)protein [Candidatus Acidoferrales bacterium]
MGVPTSPVVTVAFEQECKTNAAKRGMPRLRLVFSPHPVWGKTPEQLWGYMNGPDPATQKPMMQEVIGALTKPLTAADTKTGKETPSVGPPTFEPDTAKNLQDFYRNNGYTDFLPIIIPTEEAVDEMLKGTSHHPDEVVGKLGAGGGTEAFAAWTFTVKHAAINAVMAGAKPEHLPVILAMASSGYISLISSTNDLAYGALVNGPIRNKLNMNYGIGALGPFAHANAAIGRAWTLVSKNLGNAGIPGETYMGDMGNMLNYMNLIMAENEEASPWEPFHVQHGFKKDENVVSMFSGLSVSAGQVGKGSGVGGTPFFDKQYVDLFYNFTGFFGALLLCEPICANSLKEQGYDTKEKLIDYFYKNTTQTAKEYRDRNWSYLFEYGRALRGEEPFATWYKLPDETVIPKFPNPNRISVVVIGGSTDPVSQVANFSYGKSVSIDKWM